MAIPRDLTLPWVPDRLGSGSIYDLNGPDEPVRVKPPMGFSRGPAVDLHVALGCSAEVPCGWCPDCQGL